MLLEALVRGLASVNKCGLIVNEHVLSRAATRRHVDVLGKWFEFIHHDDLLDRIENPGPRPFCLFTFDDGKMSNYTESAPELARLGVPAVFYIVSSAAEKRTIQPYDWWRAVVDKLGDTPEDLTPELFGSLPFGELQARLQRAADQAELDIESLNDDATLPMTWEHVKKLAEQGFTIGAHTVSHTNLLNETRERAKMEIRDSILDVSSALGSPCQTFAFPYGSCTNELARYAQSCGVTSVMTTVPIWLSKNTSPWYLPRVQLFEQQSPRKIMSKVGVSALGCVIKNPNGEGRQYVRDRSHLAPASGVSN